MRILAVFQHYKSESLTTSLSVSNWRDRGHDRELLVDVIHRRVDRLACFCLR